MGSQLIEQKYLDGTALASSLVSCTDVHRAPLWRIYNTAACPGVRVLLAFSLVESFGTALQ